MIEISAEILKRIIVAVCILTLIICLSNCAPPAPSHDVVLELVKKEFVDSPTGRILEISVVEIKSRKKLSERDERIVYPAIVQCKYVIQGLATGWIAGSGPYFEKYYDDRVYQATGEFMIGQDEEGEWAILRKQVSRELYSKHQRPVTKSLDEFYNDNIQNN